MKVGSLFSGVGGLDLGFEQAGFEVAFQCEIDPYAQSVLRHRFPNTPLFSDVRQLRGADLPAVDVLIGGSPCQDLSVAGRRAGLEGARSGLFFEFVRLIRECRPCFAILENVPGLLSSAQGADFQVVLDELAEVGAMDIAWRVVDAQFFGVPQRRRRVFLVVDFGGECAGEVLFEPAGVSGHPEPRRAQGEDVANTLGGGSGRCGWAPDTDRMTFGDEGHPVPQTPIGTPACPDGPANAVNTRSNRYDGESQAFVVSAAPFDERVVTSAGNRSAVRYGTPAPTLNDGGEMAICFHPTQDPIHSVERSHAMGTEETGSVAVQTGLAVRRLTPRECERLQGWPDDWTRWDDWGREIADTHRYRMIGNGVATPCARYIAERLAAVAASEQEAAA